MTCQFILYACPTGPLASQLDTYFHTSQAQCGPNTAHRYMPHCTLTGFFHDRAAAADGYLEQLETVYQRHRDRQEPVQVVGLEFRPGWQGLTLKAPTLKPLVLDFVRTSQSPTRQEAIRPKDWLHLSLAYGFAPNQALQLEYLARQLVNPNAPAGWELRFYQRDDGSRWCCHRRWPLSSLDASMP